MKKYFIAGVVILLLIFFLWTGRAQPTGVEVDSVRLTPLSVVLGEEGETRVRDRFEVSAPVSGRVLRILLEPGDQVVADETLLARFLPVQPVLLDARSLAQARASVKTAQSDLGRAQADQKRIDSEVQFAEAERQRYARLLAEGVVSAEQLERATLSVDTLEEAARASQFAVAAARGSLQVEQARLLQSSSDTGARTLAIEIFSPVDGVVLRRTRESEAVVGAGELLIEVGDPRSLEVVADFLSNDAVKMAPGQDAKIDGWGGEPLRAKVRRVEPSGFTKISALGVEEQRVNVILDLNAGQDAALRLGDAFRVEVGVTVWSSESEVTVDNGALFRRGGAWALYVVEAGRATERIVEIGRRGARRSQVLGGIEEGEEVVIYPPSSLVEGVSVKPINH